ncbi:hypothetical protein Micbo1qcDRAFT_207781 [Microdochium bolleyi]|uniref:Uncharacterized protein n=1 Tax=Microdochium bolleyi TaxID=196109 RepID=A0A136IT15_9PEZI|nr:hypothetical protein Micbo1qcDRAFT_207781 [Microdochium bolleyi]
MRSQTFTLVLCLALGFAEGNPVEPRWLDNLYCKAVKLAVIVAKEETPAEKYCVSYLGYETPVTKYETKYEIKYVTKYETKYTTKYTTKTGDPKFHPGECYYTQPAHRREAEVQVEPHQARMPIALAFPTAEPEGRSVEERGSAEEPEAWAVEERRNVYKPKCFNPYPHGPAMTSACKCLNLNPHPTVTVTKHETKYETKYQTKYETKYDTTTVPGPKASCFVLRNGHDGYYAKADNKHPGSEFEFDASDKNADVFKLNGHSCELQWTKYPVQHVAAYTEDKTYPGIVKLYKDAHGAKKLSGKVNIGTHEVTIYPGHPGNKPYDFAVNKKKEWIETYEHNRHGYYYGKLYAYPVVCKK